MSPVFVVGVPRSGTTVLSLKLAEATGIAMAPETHFMPEVYGQLKHLDLADDRAVDKAIERFRSGRWFADLGLEPDQVKKTFSAREPRDWPTLFATVLELYAQTNGASHWGEKTPGHYRFVRELLRWYPNCRIIFVMRDPRAVVASNLRAPFSPSYAWFVARRWREVWDIYEPLSDDPRVSMVRYEDFVADSEKVLRLVKDLLDIEGKRRAEPRTAFGGSTSQKGWREQHLQAAAGTVNAKSVSLWREQLSPYEVWVTDQAAGPGPAQCGYGPASVGAGQWRHRIKYFFRFPIERLELAISAATHVATDEKKPTLKQRMLWLAGRGIDKSILLPFLIKATVKESKPSSSSRILIFLGRKHSQESSFTPLVADSEVLGVFTTALYDMGYEVHLAARTYRQFHTANRIIHAFGLGDRAKIIRARFEYPEGGNRVEIYRPERVEPVHCIENLDITPLKAKETAERIDALCRMEVSGNEVQTEIDKG